MDSQDLRNRRSVLALALAVPLMAVPTVHAHAQPPTSPWVRTHYDYTIQKPYNLSQSARYRYSGGEHKMWVYSTDQPHTPGSPTDPRTEMRFNQEYSSGRRAWAGQIYIPWGVSGATVVQILRGNRPAGTRATDIMLNIGSENNGTLRKDSNQVIATGVYGQWFWLRVEHTAYADRRGEVKVYYKGSLKLIVPDEGPATRYFKNGVYHHGSGRAEARFKDVTYWRR